MPYIDPGDAFSTTLRDVALQQQQQRRQALLDSLQVQREQRIAAQQDQELKFRQSEFEQKQHDTKLKQHLDIRHQMVPGDIPDASYVKEAEDLGVPLKLAPPPTSTIPAGQGTVGMPEAGGGVSQVSMPGAQPAETLQTGPAPYAGDPSQRLRIQLADSIDKGTDPSKIISQALRLGADPKEVEAAISTIRGPKPTVEPTLVPHGPDGKTIGGVVSVNSQGVPMLNGQPLPEGITVHRMDPAGGGTEMVYKQDPKLGTLVKVGEVPKGSHFMSEPQPPPPIIIQGAGGPMVTGPGRGTATPVLGPDHQPIEAKPSAATQTMMDGARMLRPHIPELESMAQELNKRGLFGPIMSRVRQAAVKYGTLLDSGDPDVSAKALSDIGQEIRSDPDINSDRLAGKFATTLGLMASGAGRVHGGARGGGSIQMIDYMKSLLGDSSTIDMFGGRLDALDSFMKIYATGGRGMEAPAAPPASRYKVTITKPGGD